MIFWNLSPVPPCTWVPFFWERVGGGSGGAKLLCALWPLCVHLDLDREETFFLYMEPLAHGGGPRSLLRVPQVAPSAPIMATCQ